MQKDTYFIMASVILTGLMISGALIYNSKNKSETAFLSPSLSQKGDSPENLKAEVGIDGDPMKGNENAAVTIIEFSDFECPFCGIFYRNTLPLLEEKYIKTGKVRFIYRDFPLAIHRNAQKAAEAAECAKEQGKFWEMHDIIFENQSALSLNDLKRYGQSLGLEAGQFNNCLEGGKYEAEVKNDIQSGLRAGVSGTPTFFINGQLLVGAQPFNVFEEIIENELK